jgi:hypothetical protein
MKSHRNFTRTEFIYIFVSINEKEIEFNSRFYYLTRKMAKTASINMKLSNSLLYNNLNIFKNVAWKFRLLFKNYIDLCIATTYSTTQGT